MIELLQITNDPALAQRCDHLGGVRLFVDLERLGKQERQAGRDTFISVHQAEDPGRIKRVLRHSRLMVRLNPLHHGTASEIDSVVEQGADMVMLPMFREPAEVVEFSRMVAGRVPIVPLLETAQALESLSSWVRTPGLAEVFVGLNDLHMSLGMRFMFEPLAAGLLDGVAQEVKQAGLRFGFGGIARLDGGDLPGRDVLAEHLRLGSSSVILSRTFHQSGGDRSFEDEIRALRQAEAELAQRTPWQVEADARRIAAHIQEIARRAAPRA